MKRCSKFLPTKLILKFLHQLVEYFSLLMSQLIQLSQLARALQPLVQQVQRP